MVSIYDVDQLFRMNSKIITDAKLIYILHLQASHNWGLIGPSGIQEAMNIPE